MDCFYAAVEIRDDPSLKGKPVAVGGRAEGRGVLTTCNYVARKFGCRSAMPTFQALQKCPELIVLPTRFDVYRGESQRVRTIMRRFTHLIEPLSLDEAYLDVSELNSSGASLAQEIRHQIHEETGLTASAGIAPNKFLAKIASDWRKPDGQFEIRDDEVAAFVHELPVKKIWGVGKATEARMHILGIHTCADLQKISLPDLTREFGKFGLQLHQLSHGIDSRDVESHRERKSLSTERTFEANLTLVEQGRDRLHALYAELIADCEGPHRDRVISKAFVKLKFADFSKTSAECRMPTLEEPIFIDLLDTAWARGKGRPVRLLGIGVRFAPLVGGPVQMEMFE